MTANLSRLFNAKSIAIVGASPTSQTTFAMDMVRWLLKTGFPKIFPVNPKYTDLLGLKCYPSLAAIPEEVDYAIISVPARVVPGVLEDCARKNIGAVSVFSSGFSEASGPGGKELEQVILSICRKAGIRMLGPNSTGCYVPGNRMVNGEGQNLEPGSIGFISQSGGNANEIIYRGQERGLRFSKVVSYGNALEINESDLLEYFAADPKTEMIGVYLEGVRDGARFKQALRLAAAVKPVVIYKGGRTAAGHKAVQGHTGSIAGQADIFGTVCRQCGALSAESMDEIIDLLMTIKLVSPIPSTAGVAVIGTGGGPSVLASDQLEEAGLILCAPSSETAGQLGELLPSAGGIFSNPIDASNLLDPKVIVETAKILGNMPENGAVIYHLGFHPLSHWGTAAINQIDIKSFVQTIVSGRKDKPLLLVLKPPPGTKGMDSFLDFQKAAVSAGLPVYYSFSEAGSAMAKLIPWQRKHKAKLL